MAYSVMKICGKLSIRKDVFYAVDIGIKKGQWTMMSIALMKSKKRERYRPWCLVIVALLSR